MMLQDPQVALWSQGGSHLHPAGGMGGGHNSFHQNYSSTDQQEISVPGGPSW